MLPLTPGCESCRDLKERFDGCCRNMTNARLVGRLEGLEEALEICRSGATGCESLYAAITRVRNAIDADARRS